MSLLTESPLKKFNSTVYDCLTDFKKIFGEADQDIRFMEGAYELTKVNMRLFLSPFQVYISGNPEFVNNIMEMNTAYFISYDFEQMLTKARVSNDYTNKLIIKFREATIARQHEIKTIHAIFNWFKVMIYYAFLDQGKNPTEELKLVADSMVVSTVTQ